MKKKIALIFFIVAIIIIILFLSLKNRKKDELYVNNYLYKTVEKTDKIGELILNGQILANNPIGIFVDKKLKVKEVKVKNGDYIEKGEVLITFEDDEKNKLLRNIEKENIALNKIGRQVKVSKELYKIGGVSFNELKDLEGSYRISKLNLEEMREELNKTAKEIKSPVSGVITNIKAQKNYLVDTNSSLMEVINSDDLRIVIEIPEYDSGLVKIGQEVELKTEVSEEEKLYKGSVKKISKISTISNLTSENVIEAEVEAKESIPNLIPGFKIKAKLTLKSEEKNLIIPKTSLVFENNDYYVFKLEDDVVKKQKVAIKNITGDNIIITEGLKVGDNVITTPDIRLKDNLKLKKES